MNRYKIICPIDDTSYCSIFKAEHKETHDNTQIRQLKKKYYTWQEALNLREIKILRVLQHPNILKLKEIIRTKDDVLNLVFEYIEETLFKFYQRFRDKGKNLPEVLIRHIGQQLATVMMYIQKSGYFHRDLTLDTIYIDQNHDIKIGHFNNSRELNARAPLTDYVSTRWYRAPEQLLRTTNYNYKIDIFAFGCILGELYLMGPLFSGASELDQLNKICSIIGTPSHQDWPEFFTLSQKLKIKVIESQPSNFSQIFPKASPEALDLLKKVLVFNPAKRYSWEDIVKHPYFSEQKNVNQQQEMLKYKDESLFNSFQKQNDSVNQLSPSLETPGTDKMDYSKITESKEEEKNDQMLIHNQQQNDSI